MRQILNRAFALTDSNIVPASGHGSTSVTNYREPLMAPWQLLSVRTPRRRSFRDMIELVGLVVLALILGSAAAVLMAVVLRACVAAV